MLYATNTNSKLANISSIITATCCCLFVYQYLLGPFRSSTFNVMKISAYVYATASLLPWQQGGRSHGGWHSLGSYQMRARGVSISVECKITISTQTVWENQGANICTVGNCVPHVELEFFKIFFRSLWLITMIRWAPSPFSTWEPFLKNRVKLSNACCSKESRRWC